jgi:hypothetical protein
VEARGPDPRGQSLGGEKVKRGSTANNRVTPAWWNGLSGCAPPRSRSAVEHGRTSVRPGKTTRNGMEDSLRREAQPHPERETL